MEGLGRGLWGWEEGQALAEGQRGSVGRLCLRNPSVSGFYFCHMHRAARAPSQGSGS